MRFLFKMAFWLALIAFFLPSPRSDDSAAASVDYLSAFMGAQQALGDMGGFCERSPLACAAGQDVGSYVMLRVKDGVSYAIATLAPSSAPTPAPAVATEPTAAPDPMATAAVGAEHVRRFAGLPPYGTATDAPSAPGSQAAPRAVLQPMPGVIPTPAPRP